ncbi:MAG: hypothetical protein JSR12_08270 [Bacteroidetes bacterium]|nr:hypothetical protein [Bacteroidota bacterium]
MQNVLAGYNLTIEKNLLNTNANIHFTTLHTCKITIRVLNQNENIKLLTNEVVNKGKHTVLFNYCCMPEGIYNIILLAETETTIDKETVIIQI